MPAAEAEGQEQARWSAKTLVVLAAALAVVLTVVLALFTGAAGVGFRSHKLMAVSYFINASGLKPGATVRLDGVAIGNVKSITISPAPEHRKSPVEVLMKLDGKYQVGLRSDSPAALTTSGALGDTEIDISTEHAVGPPLRNGGELPAVNLVDSLKGAQVLMDNANRTVAKLDTVVDAVVSGKGSIGKFMSDKDLMNNVRGTTDAAHQIGAKLNSNNNSVGKLLTDHSLMDRLSSVGKNIDGVEEEFGKVTGRPLQANIDETQTQMKSLSATINSGQGSVGMMIKDPSVGKKITDTVNQADDVAAKLNKKYGEASETQANLGKLKGESNALVSKIMSDPKKYLSIDVRIF
jgi:phospholipid/cholesterol/gamma-HCH transport system substrate-binding protein